MRTDDLIRSLALDLKPVSARMVERRVAIGLCGGAVASLIMIAVTIGFRPDLDIAVRGFVFWMKLVYTFSIGLCAVAATVHLSRPDATRARWLWALAIPIAGLMVIAGLELWTTPTDGWLSLFLGRSWRSCPWRIFNLSLPLYIGLLWAFRQFAPARLGLAGAVAGLAAGGLAATLYCLHCPEASAVFVLTWYTLGIVLAGVMGSILGPKLMRW